MDAASLWERHAMPGSSSLEAKPEQKDEALDRIPDPEDLFELSQGARTLRAEKDIPNSFYKGTQDKLGDLLLQRAQLIMNEGRPLHEKFDDVSIQIYTTNINMLEGQTRQRIQEPASEFFHRVIYNDPELLSKMSQDSVKKYNLRSKDVSDQAKRLKNEAKENPHKLFLIVADEAHWGIRNNKDTKKGGGDKEDEDLKEISGAYQELVNDWSGYKNALILQVTATPYNLLTENTRLDLDKIVTAVLSPAVGTSTNLAPQANRAFARRLHHVRWSEGFEHYLQKGLVMVLFCQFKEQNCLLHLKRCPQQSEQYVDLLPWEPMFDDEDQNFEENLRPEFLFEGRLENTTITTTDRDYCLVACTVSKKVGFIPYNQLEQNKARYIHEFCIDVSYGEDAFCIFTSDLHYQLYIPEEQKVALKDMTSNVRSRGFPRDPFTDMPKRNDLFMVKLKKTLGDLAYGLQYMSLNALIASTAEEQQFKRFLRSDDNFRKMKRKIPSSGDTAKRNCFILGADYCFYILIINKLREARLNVTKFEDMISNLSIALGDYTESIEVLKENFCRQVVERQQKLISIECIRQCIEVTGFIAIDNLYKYLKEYIEESPSDLEENLEAATNLLCYILDCCLFASKGKLDALSRIIQSALKRNERKSHFLSQAFKDFEEKFESKYKPMRIKENETCRIIDDLAMKQDTTVLNGRMKVLRIKGGRDKKLLGNKIYSTMCLARKIASEGHYSFEILRDYDTFRISEVEKLPRHVQEKTAVFRIRQLFQQRKCERCPCAISEPGEGLKCLKCHHLHKTVDTYEDLNQLPLLLIVINKGRMGDTFPPSFNFMDMRLTTDINHLSTMVQELGRLCRYTNKEDIANIPYALLAEAVEKTIMNARNENGIYHAISKFCKGGRNKYVDPRINVATKESVDYRNHIRDSNRMLLDAETQIGKTGAYINFCSKVRKDIQGKKDRDANEEVECESDDEMDIDLENETTAEVNSENDIDLKDEWQRPLGEKMKKSKPLVKEIHNGKYTRIYGPYIYGQKPDHSEIMIPKKKRSTKSKKPDGNNTLFKAHKKDHWDRCSQCKDLPQEIQVIKRCIAGGEIEISVPLIMRMKDVLDTLEKGYFDTSSRQGEPKLQCWIFTPSFGRHDLAYLNIKHTMVDMNDLQASYIQILVVQSSEFKSYFQTWASSHVIISLPESMPEYDNETPASGGVGYARRFIQRFASQYKLDAIFMLDDNILYSKQVIFTKKGGRDVVERKDGKYLGYKAAPLFCLLKDLEDQHFNKNKPAPKKEFIPSKEVQSVGTQESYTGPWSSYGLLGVMKNRGTNVCVRQPFIRTHVTSLVLLNIDELQKKDVRYKPWNVREDLDFNNQADVKDLLVVKYNKWVISKVFIRDWLCKVYFWNEETKLIKPALFSHPSKSDCKKVISHYINECLPVCYKINIPPSEDDQPSDIMEAAKSVIIRDSSPFILLTLGKNGLDLGLDECNFKIIEEHLSSSGNLLILLPAAILYEKNESINIETVINHLKDRRWLPPLPDGCDYQVITSGNVKFVSVSLILVTIVTPGVPERVRRRPTKRMSNGPLQPSQANDIVPVTNNQSFQMDCEDNGEPHVVQEMSLDIAPAPKKQKLTTSEESTMGNSSTGGGEGDVSVVEHHDQLIEQVRQLKNAGNLTVSNALTCWRSLMKCGEPKRTIQVTKRGLMDAIFQEIRNDPCDVLELQFVWAKVSAKSQGAAVKGAETRDIFNLCMDKIRRQPMWGSTEEGLVLQRDDNCMHADQYWIMGMVMALSLFHDAHPPACLAPVAYNLLFEQEVGTITAEMVGNKSTRDLLLKASKAEPAKAKKDLSHLTDLLGIKPVITTKYTRDQAIERIAKFAVVENTATLYQSMRDGLRLGGLYSMVKDNMRLFQRSFLDARVNLVCSPPRIKPSPSKINRGAQRDIRTFFD